MVQASSFAAYLARLMKRRGMTPAKIAHYAGVGSSTVMGWQRGARPKPETLEKLARALKEPLSEMAAAAGYPTSAAATLMRDEVDGTSPAAPPISAAAALEELARRAGVPVPERIPVQESWVHAGDGGIEGQFVYRLPEWHGRRVVVFVVRGRCMEPDVEPGDRVAVDLDQSPVHDDLVVVDVDGQAMVRVYDARRQELTAQDGSPPIPFSAGRTLAPVIEITSKPRRRRQLASR